MSRVVIDGLLALVVLTAWLGCIGFARLRSALDRVHCVAFVNTAAGTALTVAAFVADGGSSRAFKILLVACLSLLAGAAMSHATGRALVERGSAPETGGEASVGDGE